MLFDDAESYFEEHYTHMAQANNNGHVNFVFDSVNHVVVRLDQNNVPNSPTSATNVNVPELPASEKGRIVINVGGKQFTTLKTTLARHPNSRLGKLDENDPCFDRWQNEYFFDRNPKVFAGILEYYRVGELHVPHNLCGPSIKKEFIYWGIDEKDLSPCCKEWYQSYDKKVQTRNALLDEFECLQDIDEILSGKLPNEGAYYWRWRLWFFLEHPRSSKAAEAWSLGYAAIVVLSIFTLCARSSRSARIRLPFVNQSYLVNSTMLYFLEHTRPEYIVETIDNIAMFLLTAELFFRFLVTPHKKAFMKAGLHILHLLVCISYILLLCLEHIEKLQCLTAGDLLTFYSFLWATQAFRVLRIFDLARHFLGLNVLLLAIKSSKNELVLLTVFLLLGTVIYSGFAFYGELDYPDSQFKDIGLSGYWAIVTMTTVGYGDIVPNAPAGYIVGVMCAVTGIVITGLAIPIISNKFNLYYNFVQSHEIQDYMEQLNETWYNRMNDVDDVDDKRGDVPECNSESEQRNVVAERYAIDNKAFDATESGVTVKKN